MNSSCKKQDHVGDHHTSRGVREHQPAEGISFKTKRTQLATEQGDSEI